MPLSKNNKATLRALILEECEPLAKSVKRQLGALDNPNYQFDCNSIQLARSVKEAIQIIDQNPPDLIISGMVLSEGETGRDFYEWIENRRSGLLKKFIFMSWGVPFEEKKGYQLLEKMKGEGRLIEKPASSNQIKRIVGEVIRK